MERTKTNADLAALALRISLGAVIFPHGAQKLLGWFGGYGYSGTLNFFQSALGIPAALGTLAIAAEFLGSIGLALGISQFAAIEATWATSFLSLKIIIVGIELTL